MLKSKRNGSNQQKISKQAKNDPQQTSPLTQDRETNNISKVKKHPIPIGNTNNNDQEKKPVKTLGKN